MKTNTFFRNRIAGIILTTLLLGLVGTTYGQKSETKKKAIVWETDNKELKWGPCPEFMPEGCEIAVLQGNPQKPNTDIFFKINEHTTVPRHWHHSPERMVMVSGKMLVTYDGQKPEIIKTGYYAYGPAEKPHVATCISDEPCILFIAFEDPIDAMPVTEGSNK